MCACCGRFQPHVPILSFWIRQAEEIILQPCLYEEEHRWRIFKIGVHVLMGICNRSELTLNYWRIVEGYPKPNGVVGRFNSRQWNLRSTWWGTEPGGHTPPVFQKKKKMTGISSESENSASYKWLCRGRTFLESCVLYRAILFVYLGVKHHLNYYFATSKHPCFLFEHMYGREPLEYAEVVSKWSQNKAPAPPSIENDIKVASLPSQLMASTFMNASGHKLQDWKTTPRMTWSLLTYTR